MQIEMERIDFQEIPAAPGSASSPSEEQTGLAFPDQPRERGISIPVPVVDILVRVFPPAVQKTNPQDMNSPAFSEGKDIVSLMVYSSSFHQEFSRAIIPGTGNFPVQQGGYDQITHYSSWNVLTTTLRNYLVKATSLNEKGPEENLGFLNAVSGEYRPNWEQVSSPIRYLHPGLILVPSFLPYAATIDTPVPGEPLPFLSWISQVAGGPAETGGFDQGGNARNADITPGSLLPVGKDRVIKPMDHVKQSIELFKQQWEQYHASVQNMSHSFLDTPSSGIPTSTSMESNRLEITYAKNTLNYPLDLYYGLQAAVVSEMKEHSDFIDQPDRGIFPVTDMGEIPTGSVPLDSIQAVNRNENEIKEGSDYEADSVLIAEKPSGRHPPGQSGVIQVPSIGPRIPDKARKSAQGLSSSRQRPVRERTSQHAFLETRQYREPTPNWIPPHIQTPLFPVIQSLAEAGQICLSSPEAAAPGGIMVPPILQEFYEKNPLIREKISALPYGFSFTLLNHMMGNGLDASHQVLQLPTGLQSPGLVSPDIFPQPLHVPLQGHPLIREVSPATLHSMPNIPPISSAGRSVVTNIENSFNITVEVKNAAEERDLKELGRKIGAILSEEIKRYGGAV